MTAALAVATAVTFVWLGMVVAIASLEAHPQVGPDPRWRGRATVPQS